MATRDTWRTLVLADALSQEEISTLDALEGLTPLVIDGERLPRETVESKQVALNAMCFWLEEAYELGLITLNEVAIITDDLRFALK